MILIRPCINEIERYVNLNDIHFKIEIPTLTKEEWYKSHRDFVLMVLMPLINPPLHVRRILTEAYLTDVFLEKTKETKSFEEVLSNGSTLVPNIAYRWGNIKDPWGIAHDFVYIIHKLKLRDIYLHDWSLIEAHDMYRDGWLSQKNPLIAWTWWSGLMIGGWFSWNFKFNNRPEKLTSTEYRICNGHTTNI